ncbi:unnamed protein product [Tuber aestivum]|uniref:Peroxisome membrane anchor protein Pex14p N-terminal domain-containing protein n=1 Tax=Tuber aestivum TaxID=59557 RepID=A0A292Q2W1_9PEZI|nr:unnamed protein product [Tuber aestivum]
MPTKTPTPTTTGVPADLKTIHESSPNQSKQLPPPEARTREELREQAAKFLEASSTKNAPWEQKKEFLLEKGLTGDEIEALVEEMETVQKRNMEQATATKEEVKAVLKKAKGKKKKPEERPSTAATKAGTDDKTKPSPKDSDRGGRRAAAAAAAISPPLITYPEFLTPTPPPPPQPLVSASNILKSAYFASAVGSTIYGAHKFIFTPMYSTLTDARLDLSSTALKNLTELNTRLRDLVPSRRIQHPTANSNEKAYYPSSSSGDEDDSSSTSDPSELFHVDATTQTSPLLDYHPNTSDEAEDLTPDGKLEHLSTQLHALVESHSDGMDNELTFALEDLRSYLESLTYDWSGSSIFTSPYEYAGAKGKDGKDDAVAKVKAEIRSVKGVLLNTKNFPASR